MSGISFVFFLSTLWASRERRRMWGNRNLWLNYIQIDISDILLALHFTSAQLWLRSMLLCTYPTFYIIHFLVQKSQSVREQRFFRLFFPVHSSSTGRVDRAHHESSLHCFLLNAWYFQRITVSIATPSGPSSCSVFRAVSWGRFHFIALMLAAFNINWKRYQMEGEMKCHRRFI